MMTALLLVIFIAFIGVGLPDSLLGAAWPVMRLELEAPLGLAGAVSATVSVGTILSSLLSARLIRRFGTGMVAAGCTLLTGLALLGYSLAGSKAMLFLLAIPLGLGAGSIDTGLNNFVALHYSAAKMNFLHCFYGIGVAVSPFILSLALGEGGDWRRGYRTVAMLQLGIAALSFLALPLWRRAEARDSWNAEGAGPRASLGKLMQNPKARLCCLIFFSACALEVCAGAWSSSYFVNSRGLGAEQAARGATYFYVGMALGRFLSGLLAHRLGRRLLLRWSAGVLLAGLILFALPLPTAASMAALGCMGLGMGPIYPNMSHLTPDIFGKGDTVQAMAAEQTATYIGVLAMPYLLGQLGQRFSMGLMPGYLLALFALFAGALWSLLRRLGRTGAPKEAENGR